MSLTFIHITDTHLGTTCDELVYFYAPGQALKAVVKQIAADGAYDASFIADTGDMIRHWSYPSAYETGKRIYGFEERSPAPGPLRMRAEGMDLPWYYVPGNVDNRLECRNRLFAPDPGTALFNYTWKVQGIRFLSLDWGASGTNRYTLNPQSFNWLKKQLSQSCPTVILTHHPPVPIGIPMFDEMTPPDLNRLHELIAGSPVLAIFHGHTHHPWENRIDGIPVFGTGSVTYRRCLHHNYAQGMVLEIHPPQYRVVTIHSDGSVSAPIHEVPLGP